MMTYQYTSHMWILSSMYRHLYCYTLNRSVFIKWEGKVYIITHNYLYT